MYLWMMLKSIRCFDPLSYTPTTSKADNNEYQLGRLKNEMIVLLVRDPNLTEASICLGVEAGTQDDPIAIEGIAHLTEHLIKRLYTQHNIMNRGLLTEELFLLPATEHIFNTEEHTTTYLLHTTNRGIERVANIMAMVMAAPLFTPVDIALEAEVIDTEFGLRTHHPSFIRTDILADLHATNGYILREGCGNRRTLVHPDTAKSAKQFWEKNYYGQKMSLVIFSSLSFEVMQKVADKFERIRSNPGITKSSKCTREYDQKEARSLLASFRPVDNLKLKADALQYIYRTKATGYVSLMCITIILPSFQKYDQSVPLGLVQYLINAGLETDAQSRLNDLGCATPGCLDMHDSYDDYAELTIELPLTTQGVAHYREVLDTVLKTLKNVDLSEDSLRPWVHEKKVCWDAATNKYTHDRIKNMSIEALFKDPSDIISGSHRYEVDEIDQQLIRGLFSYIADLNNWIVVIMDKDYKPGEGDMHHSKNNTYYGREKKPSYSPESQCYAYAQPRAEDAPKAQSHGYCKCTNYYTSGLIQRASNPLPNVERQDKTWTIGFKGDSEYTCLYLLLLELARMNVQATQSADNRSIDGVVFITVYTEPNSSECKFTLRFRTEGTEDALRKTVEQYIEEVKNPRISNAFEVAKARALGHHLSQSTLPMMSERARLFLTGRGIDQLAQTEAISSLQNEEILGMPILQGIRLSDINLTEENGWNTTLILSSVSLPDYLNRCKLLECVNENMGLCIPGPMSDTVAYSYCQYKIRNAYTILCDIPGIKLNREDAEKPLCYMYNAFMCELIARLLRPTFIMNEAQPKLHAYRPEIDVKYIPSHNAACFCLSVPSKSPIEDHLRIIDAFVVRGNDVIEKMSSTIYNRAFETIIDEMQFEKYVEQFACVVNGQTQLDAEISKQKRQLREVMTQKNVVSIYSHAIVYGRALFIPSRQSEL